MGLLSGVSDFFGLDIGTTSIRVVQLKGSAKHRSLYRYGAMDVDMKISRSDSDADQVKLSEQIVSLVNQVGITTKNVAVGIPSARSYAAVVDMQRLPAAELEKTIKYQADNYIPQTLDDVKLDWAVLGDSPKDVEKVEVMLCTTPKEFAEKRLNALEAAGFNVVSMEPDPLALMRALTVPEDPSGVMILDIGDQSTDIVIAANGAPKLIRAIPTGGKSFVRSAVQNLNVDDAQAAQFVYKFGMSQDKLEGQVYKALKNTVDNLISDVEKSVKFYKNRYGKDLDKIIVTGGASTLPEFPLYLANSINIPVEIGNSWLNVAYPNNIYNDLISVSSRFGVTVGLALRQE